MYVIIEKDYTASKSSTLTDEIKSRCENGEISVLNVENMTGMNLPENVEAFGGEWSEINKYPNKYSVISKGDKIKVASDVKDVLVGLGFAEGTSMAISQKYADTEQVAQNVWYDDEQGYVTVDLCVEIPIDCCGKVK